MKERWLPAGVFAGTLFAVNIVARIVVRLAAGKDDGKQIWIGLVELIAVGIVALVAAALWVRRLPMPRAVGDLVVGVLVGGVLSTVVGPFISGGKALGDGFGYFITQMFYYAAVCGLGALFGALGVMVAGLDYKSQSWKRYATVIQSQPRKVARR
jgi:MFS family permease